MGWRGEQSAGEDGVGYRFGGDHASGHSRRHTTAAATEDANEILRAPFGANVLNLLIFERSEAYVAFPPIAP